MPRYISIPTEEVTLVNQTNGRRMKRQTDVFEQGGQACARCGETRSQMLEEDPPYSMLRWLDTFILVDQKLQAQTTEKNGREVHTAEGSKTIRLLVSVRKAFRNKKPGDEVVLDEPYWERIKEILEKPGNIWIMSQMIQFDTYFDAWAAATDTSRADLAKKARETAEAAAEKKASEATPEPEVQAQAQPQRASA